MALLALCGVASAAPYRPVDAAEVLDRVPRGSGGRLRPPPQSVEAAAVLARAYIERSRREGDPRWLGYAEGVLQRWWNEASPPLPVLLLRATLLQSRHQFDAALRDLDAILQQNPDDAQAWLTRATVLRVLGRYPEAAQSCNQLTGLTDDFIAALCSAAVRGLSGRLGIAVGQLTQLEQASAGRPTAIRAWCWAELAEALERRGDRPGAEAIYRKALIAAADDIGLRAAYADFLLDQGRAGEAAQLIQAHGPGHERIDALRLRLLLAQQAQGRADPVLRSALADAFVAAHRRNEELHLREEARFTLEALGDAPRALQLAQQNWAIQHEPWDARLLLAAAQAAQQPQAAQPVLDWLQQSGYEDARLQPLRVPLP